MTGVAFPRNASASTRASRSNWFESDTCEGRRLSDQDFTDVKLVIKRPGHAPIAFTGFRRISQTYACGSGGGRVLFFAIVVFAGLAALVILLIRRARGTRRASSTVGSVL